MRTKKIAQLLSVFLLIGLTISSVYGAFLTYKAYVEIYGEKYPLGQVEIDIKRMEPIEGLEAREDYIGEIRVWTYSNDTELILQLVQVSHIVYNFRSFTVKVCMPLDVIFVVDEGNMGAYMDTVKEQLTRLVDLLPLMNKMPVRFGVVGFTDALTKQLSLTDNYADVKTFIGSLTATTTVPSPQSHYLGLQAALDDFDANSAIDIEKVVIFITDAEAGIANSPSFDEARIRADALAERGIKIHAVLCGPDEYPENAQLKYYADGSIGNYIGPEGQHRIVAGSTANPTWIVKLTPVTPFDSFRFKLNSSPPCEQEGFYTLSVYVDFYANAIPWHDFFIVELAAHLEKAQKPPPPTSPNVCEPPSSEFFYVGRDLTTRGDWIEHGYGNCGYALPYAELKSKQVATGETTGIGEPTHESWWVEPWSVPGERYYPYEDYLGGDYILEYEISGPEGPPRALVDADSMYFRPSWYYHDSSITVTLNGIAGDYRVSIYLLDWDAPTGGARRKVDVTVTTSGDWDTVTLGTLFTENFAAGTYAIFEVNSDGIIEIEVVNLNYPAHPERYAVIAGIFLDAITGPVTGVNFLELDRETMGNWRPLYGNEYYLLPGFNVPVSGVSYVPIDKSFDETNIPLGDYDMSEGVCQYAADDARTYTEYPYIGRYSAYAWTLPLDKTATDPRVLVYPEDKIYYGYPPPLNGRIYGQWDPGELLGLLNSFTVKLNIPEGYYLLSVYAMDFGLMGRSETIEIWDEAMTTMLDSRYITSDEINEGIYVQWFVQGPKTINIKVIGDPGNLNSFIDGIFLNCVCPCCYH